MGCSAADSAAGARTLGGARAGRGRPRMGMTRDLFKKIRDIRGTFHAKMGTIKVRNDMDLTEAEDIKKR